MSLGLARARRWPSPISTRRLVLTFALSSLAITAVVMLGVLRGRAISDDELTYRMQATFFGEGKLADGTFDFVPPDLFTIGTLRGYTGKYLPGEGLVQLVGVAVGIPALLHLGLLGVTLYAWHRAIELRAGERLADYASIALSISPMVMLTAASGLSETTSLCCVALAALGLEWTRHERPRTGALLVALATGFGLATRPQSLIPIGAVLIPAAAWALVERRRFVALGLLAVTSAACIGAIGWYDHALSGSATKLPWYLQCAIEHYGFGRVWRYDAFVHTPWTALENLGVVLVRLNAWWLGFPVSLAVLGLAIWQRRWERRFGIWYLVALAIVLFELGYYSPGASDTGTLYHHELVLPGSLVAASVAATLVDRFRGLVPSLFVVHVGLGTVPFLAEQTFRLARLVQAIHGDADTLLARVTTPALVFHERRASEHLTVGWVFDTFPRRYRGQDDPIVTFPNLPEALRAKVQAAYPGRSCWYFHRDPSTEVASLVPCSSAIALMNRSESDDAPPLWIRPTAYRVTSFDQLHRNSLRRLRDASGRPIVLCCALEQARALGLAVEPGERSRCVTDSARGAD